MTCGIQEQAEDIVQHAEAGGVTARIIGGVAIAIHSPAAASPPLARNYEDTDLVIRPSDRTKIDPGPRAAWLAA